MSQEDPERLESGTRAHKHGLTLIVVTHDSAVARRAQRIGVMRKGRLTIKQDTRPAVT